MENVIIREIEISYNPRKIFDEDLKIKSSYNASKILRQFFPSLTHVEYFYILLLNNSNQVLGYKMISMGGLTSTIVDIRVVMQTALKANAVSIILSHNHPSGNLKPSQQDLKLTEKVKKAGDFLDIKVLDHIILTDETYYSFADEGQL